MKFRKIMLGALSALMITAGFTACDEDDWDAIKEGSTIEMAQNRAFLLNEGAYKQNNAGITYFNWMTDEVYGNDLYLTQNKKQLGDTGQDIIEEDGYLYVTVYGSNLIVKLNSVGVEKARVSVSSDLGQPRYMVEEDGYLYVTCYGGYIAKYKTSDLSYVSSVKVGDKPEYIIEEDGKLYCTNSGWGKDNRVAIVDIKSFNKATFQEVMARAERRQVHTVR